MTEVPDAERTVVQITDNAVLDEFHIPFGEWMSQGFDWVGENLGWLLSAVEWPFRVLIDFVVDGFLVDISWVWVVLGAGALAWLLRGFREAAFVGVALAGSGMLGDGFWELVVETLGALTATLLLCASVAIPLGVVSSKVDGMWGVVRPVLVRVQAIHPFVYMLAAVFLWGLGPVGASIITAVYALPPLTRHVYSGVRDVPSEMVEMSRAFGAPRWRTLMDVELRFAGAAIRKGLHDALPFVVLMHGLAALIGAGGLGLPLWGGLASQDIGQVASGGLAFALVAVVIDHIIQRGDGDRSLWSRSWRGREVRSSQLPLRAPGRRSENERAVGFDVPELRGMRIAATGAMIAVVSVFLPWTRDGGHLSSFGNESHKTALTGETFSGLEGAGGSWFGIVTLAIGVFIVTRCLVARLRHGAASRVVTAGGVLVAGIAMTFMTSAHLLARWPDGSTGHTALGGVAAVGGSLLALVGAVSWVRAVPEATVRQRRRPSAVGPRFRVIVGVLLLVASGFAAWSADVRVTTVVSAETHAEIDRLTRESQEKPELAAAYSGEISAILAQVRANGLVSVDGFDGDGPGLGWWTLVAGMSALAIALGTSRLHQRADRQRMMWTSVMAGLGAAAALIPLAWIATAMRSGDDGYVSGVGAALAVFGGWLIVGAWRVITEDHGMPTARDPRGYSLISGSGSSTTTAVSVGRRDA